MALSYSWTCRDRVLTVGPRPLVMGIVNVTPDSFSDGGCYLDPQIAVDHALQLVSEGADLLDIGGESTRPGSAPVPEDEELRRVLPVVQALAKRVSVPLSVDTSKAAVARQCLEAGAQIINDVTGLRGDPDMIPVVREFQAGVVVMHMLGTPATMQQNPQYTDVVREIGEFFAERLTALKEANLPPETVVLDPGIGFGKTSRHNLELIANLSAFERLGRPICLGVSRKGIIGSMVGRPPRDRMPGSLAVACYAAARFPALVLRVHDVAPTRDAAVMIEALSRHSYPEPGLKTP